jgi:hypothetical protein
MRRRELVILAAGAAFLFGAKNSLLPVQKFPARNVAITRFQWVAGDYEGRRREFFPASREFAALFTRED